MAMRIICRATITSKMTTYTSSQDRKAAKVPNNNQHSTKTIFRIALIFMTHLIRLQIFLRTIKVKMTIAEVTTYSLETTVIFSTVGITKIHIRKMIPTKRTTSMKRANLRAL